MPSRKYAAVTIASARSSADRYAPRRRIAPCVILATIFALQVLAGNALAANYTEFWPELGTYYQFNPRVRSYLDMSYSKGMETGQLGLDASASIDVSLKPMLRKTLLSEQWERSRYLWARFGYTRVFNLEGGGSRGVSENRGVIALYGKAPYFPAGIALGARVRADLRWIGGGYSDRYRLRLDVSREVEMRGHTVVPYINYEWYYDTRYDAWSRTLLQGGVEITEDPYFRYEVYLAQLNVHDPSASTTNALGIVLKWYF